MPKADLSLVGQKKGPVVTEHTWKDAALYALGVGAGPDELAFLWEEYPGGMKVLPSFCVVHAYQGWPSMGDIEWSLFLHGEQSIELFQPIPPQGRLLHTGEVVNIFDKGKGAVYHVRVHGALEDGSPLYEGNWLIFYVGAGGFGGDPGPKVVPVEPPRDREPDFAISYPVAENQAALYRLNGDVNPLHLVPEAARAGGFDRPILHGLCTYGFATRAIVNGPLNGDPDRLKKFKARFSGVVYPGDTLTTKGWLVDGRYIIVAETANGTVLNNGEAWVG